MVSLSNVVSAVKNPLNASRRTRQAVGKQEMNTVSKHETAEQLPNINGSDKVQLVSYTLGEAKQLAKGLSGLAAPRYHHDPIFGLSCIYAAPILKQDGDWERHELRLLRWDGRDESAAEDSSSGWRIFDFADSKYGGERLPHVEIQASGAVSLWQNDRGFDGPAHELPLDQHGKRLPLTSVEGSLCLPLAGSKRRLISFQECALFPRFRLAVGYHPHYLDHNHLDNGGYCLLANTKIQQPLDYGYDHEGAVVTQEGGSIALVWAARAKIAVTVYEGWGWGEVEQIGGHDERKYTPSIIFGASHLYVVYIHFHAGNWKLYGACRPRTGGAWQEQVLAVGDGQIGWCSTTLSNDPSGGVMFTANLVATSYANSCTYIGRVVNEDWQISLVDPAAHHLGLIGAASLVSLDQRLWLVYLEQRTKTLQAREIVGLGQYKAVNQDAASVEG